MQMPLAPPSIWRLIDSFFARRTMFSIMAPDEKSLKNSTSLSPFWYVTSRKRFSSLDGVHVVDRGADHRLHRVGDAARRLHLVLGDGQRTT